MSQGTIANESYQNLTRARELILRYGWNAVSYQIINPGIDHWFAPEGDALIGYVACHGVRVVAGAPICAEERLAEVVTRFEQEARMQHQHVCYFGAAGRILNLLGDCPGYSIVALGAQPVWNPQHWAERVKAPASLRGQFHRAQNKGVKVVEWPSERAEQSPELRRCLDEWLKNRPLPPLQFLVQPETLDRLEGRRIFVAERQGIPVGFLNLSPIPRRNGWLTEQFVRGKDAPNGTVELMMDAAVRAVAQEGSEYITMGLVPLTRNVTLPPPASNNPFWLRFLLGWLRAHGRRFYNFDGLERFKTKFHPEEWETIFAIANDPRFSASTLYAIASAFSGNQSPVALVLKGIGKAIRQEVRWAKQRIPGTTS